MALTHLADTSVLKRLANPKVVAPVRRLARSGLIGRSTISDLEVGYSARTAAEWDQLMEDLDAVMPSVETGISHVRRALKVQRMLAARSQRGRPLPDLVIAAVAEERGLTVLHYEIDFDRIASVTGQAVEWVVPAGTID